MNQTRLSWRMASGVAAMALALYATPVMAGNEAEVAEHLIELVKIGRGVLSEQMKNINDPAKADKGFTGDYMASQVTDRFKKSTKLDLRIPNVVPQANLYLALIQAEKEVVDEAQPIINKPGISFKGFIPAVFARRVGEQFYKKSGVRMKLTGSIIGIRIISRMTLRQRCCGCSVIRVIPRARPMCGIRWWMDDPSFA